jgi:predicted permease
MGFRNADLAVLLTLFATPSALAGYIMAKNMGNDGELAGQIVVLTTACSCVTIFFFIYFLRTWGFL